MPNRSLEKQLVQFDSLHFSETRARWIRFSELSAVPGWELSTWNAWELRDWTTKWREVRNWFNQPLHKWFVETFTVEDSVSTIRFLIAKHGFYANRFFDLGQRKLVAHILAATPLCERQRNQTSRCDNGTVLENDSRRFELLDNRLHFQS